MTSQGYIVLKAGSRGLLKDTAPALTPALSGYWRVANAIAAGQGAETAPRSQIYLSLVGPDDQDIKDEEFNKFCNTGKYCDDTAPPGSNDNCPYTCNEEELAAGNEPW